MNQPSPWILLIGGGALLNVSLMIGGAHAPPWVRYGGMLACIALGLLCIGLALRRYFEKKPEPVKRRPRRGAQVDLLPEVAARVARGAKAEALSPSTQSVAGKDDPEPPAKE